MIIWVIGLSGAGKTTIAHQLYTLAKMKNSATIFLDGDDIRDVMGNDLGHTYAEREIQASRFSRLCHLLDRNNIDVICAALSNYPEWQRWNRSKFKSYREIYLDVTLDTVIRRDPKGIYAAALNGTKKHVVGIDVEFIPPINADLVIDNNVDRTDFSSIVEHIHKSLMLID